LGKSRLALLVFVHPYRQQVRRKVMAYQPIENYGIIGDLRSTALVGMDGSID
jgi:hypothetical protein